MAKKKPKIQTTSIESAANDAFSEMEALKDELQNWYDNMHENLQGGSKGEQLQEAIDNIDGVSEIDVPDCLSNGPNLPEVSYAECGSSRPKRRDTCASMLSGASDAAREYAETLRELEYDDETGTLVTQMSKAAAVAGTDYVADDDDEAQGWPEDSDTRDTWIDECETFADECETAQSEYENVEFPGMYG